MKSFHKVFLLFEELALPFLKHVVQNKQQNLYIKYKSDLQQVKNLFPSYKFVEFVADKCKYYKYLHQAKIPVAPTVCIDLEKPSSTKYKQLRDLKWNRYFFKPQPSANSTNLINATYNNVQKNFLQHHLSQYKSKAYEKVVVQKYMKNLATKKTPRNSNILG